MLTFLTLFSKIPAGSPKPPPSHLAYGLMLGVLSLVCLAALAAQVLSAAHKIKTPHIKKIAKTIFAHFLKESF